MSFPAGASTITVTGTFPVPVGGANRKGKVVFTPTAVLVDSTQHAIYSGGGPAAIVNGAMTATLLCNDDTDIKPTGWRWRVDEQPAGGAWRTYYIDLPSTLGSTVHLDQVAEVSAPDGEPAAVPRVLKDLLALPARRGRQALPDQLARPALPALKARLDPRAPTARTVPLGRPGRKASRDPLELLVLPEPQAPRGTPARPAPPVRRARQVRRVIPGRQVPQGRRDRKETPGRPDPQARRAPPERPDLKAQPAPPEPSFARPRPASPTVPSST